MNQHFLDVIEYNMMLINGIFFIIGLIIVPYHSPFFNPLMTIHYCNHIYSLNVVGGLNCLLNVFSLYKTITIIGFISSLTLLMINGYNLHSIEPNCRDYLATNYNSVWSYYNSLIIYQCYNVISYIIKSIVIYKLKKQHLNPYESL